MSSSDSGQGPSLSTPRRIQKQLFGTAITNTSKRNLFHTDIIAKRDDAISGEESDLGPMSPLDFTDTSGTESSPAREYHSPFATPEKSPKSMNIMWDRLRPSSSSKKSNLSPFSSLKKLTRDARSSPRRKIFPTSPISPQLTPYKHNIENYIPASPTQKELESFMSDIVPETPQKDYIVETPSKDKYTERKLITPLGSVCKEIIVPPLHRRKSICTFDSNEELSPERNENSIKRHTNDSMKRHANDSMNMTNIKLMKTDEAHSIPRARASLFQDEKNTTPKLHPLSTKSFYNNTIDTKRHSFGFGWRPLITETKKRRSLPMNSHNRRSNGSTKRQSLGRINAGVRHGIKRPKIKKKRQSLATNTSIKKELKNETTEIIPDDNIITSPPLEIARPLASRPPVPRSPSPIEDPNKRFFKTNKTVKNNGDATVTVNGNIKLKVSGGKFALYKQKRHIQHVNKKRKLDNITFDTTDLTVDDPSFDTAANENDVAEILKVLEDDWADDEYDKLESLTNTHVNAQSPSKYLRVSNDVLLSPASVLTTMTSSMNIKDHNCMKNSEEKGGDETTENTTKLFPLFAKGYSSNIIMNTDEKKNRGIKRHAWQLSSKINGGSDQYQLDAGQKRFGTTQCNECGVVYQIGEPEDENAHLIYHNSIKTLKYNGWKNERVVYQDPFTGNRIITIEPSDPKHHWKKVEEVLAVVDKDLGLSDMELSNCHGKKIYMYVENKSIVGVLVAETIKTAHRMIPEFFDLDCCSKEISPVKCGVNVIWTALSHRRKGIARKLMDILRSHYYYGYIMSLDDIAFSIPTASGKIFAEKYTGSRNFKVYTDPTDKFD